jgi:hypothetical protein
MVLRCGTVAVALAETVPRQHLPCPTVKIVEEPKSIRIFIKSNGIIYLMSQVENTPIPTERRSPFPLEGKGLYTLVREVLPFKGKDELC